MAAAEAVQITRSGRYEKDGREITLPRVHGRSFSDVEIIRSAKPQESSEKASKTTYALANLGSFSAARHLLKKPEQAAVHNFANARFPGGGFRQGSRAQEESLCRESTLYASLSSPAARPFYEANHACSKTFYPPGILFSPSVAVFRNGSLRELDTPFAVTVVTAAAPNRQRRAREASADSIMNDMEKRFELLLRAATERNIRTLVLGAWGCGAFRNDPADVARLFRKMLVYKGRGEYFGTILFAIKSPADAPNVTAFRKEFADVLEDRIYLDTRKDLPKLDA